MSSCSATNALPDDQRHDSASPGRIYVDNAATSWPKPPAVIEAIRNFYLHNGAAAGRGNSTHADGANRAMDRVRNKLARLINANKGAVTGGHIVFAFNGTDALNIAIHGVLNEGDHVVATVLEHNSVLRPLRQLQRAGRISLSIVGIDDGGRVDLNQLQDAIDPATRLICLSHVSNVTGVVQPVEELNQLRRPDHCLTLVDAAQSVGHMSVDIGKLNCDLLAASGHKGLLGPLGTGFLYVGQRAAEIIRPFRSGGTGTQSESDEQPTSLPWRLEAGNMNVAGLLGLEQGIDFILEYGDGVGLDAIEDHQTRLMRRLIDTLADTPDIRMLFANSNDRSGLLSLVIDGMPSSDVSSILDSSFGIQVRAGLHCSPLIHQVIRTDSAGGTVRFSPGCFNTIEEMDQLASAFKQIALEARA